RIGGGAHAAYVRVLASSPTVLQRSTVPCDSQRADAKSERLMRANASEADARELLPVGLMKTTATKRLHPLFGSLLAWALASGGCVADDSLDSNVSAATAAVPAPP